MASRPSMAVYPHLLGSHFLSDSRGVINTLRARREPVLVFAAEGGVEAGLGGGEVVFFEGCEGFGGAVEAVHAGVFPFDADGAGVADRGQRAEGGFPGDIAPAGGDEVPAAAGVAPGQVGAQDGVPSGLADLGVFAVHVIDPVLEVPDEGDGVDALPHHVGGVRVQAEGFAVAGRVEGAVGGPVVVGDFGGVDVVGEPDAVFVEGVQDGVPAVGEVLVAAVDDLFGDGREHGDVLPDGGAGEADDGVHAEGFGEPGGVLHFLGGPLADAFGVAVAPDFGADDGLVAEVDGVIADGLAFEVVGDGPDLEVVLVKDFQLGVHVAGFIPAPGVQVVSGDGDFQAVVAPAGSQFRDFFEGQVGPLAGKQGERAGHGSPWLVAGWRAVAP